jgi:transcriptional regulator with XRE-family HTH domain
MEPTKVQNLKFEPSKLREARLARFPDLSANKVATEMLGIHRERLWQYENGGSKPSPTTLARMCALYGVDLLDLTVLEMAA